MRAKRINETIKHLSGRPSTDPYVKKYKKYKEEKRQFMRSFERKLNSLFQKAIWYGEQYDDLEEYIESAQRDLDFEYVCEFEQMEDED